MFLPFLVYDAILQTKNWYYFQLPNILPDHGHFSAILADKSIRPPIKHL